MAALQPGGETGALLDALEKRALFQLARKVGLAVMRALLPALATLRAVAEGVAPEEVAPSRDGNDKQAQALRIAQTTMLPKLCEQRRIAALALFTLAKDLELFALAKEYREPDRVANEEAEVARMAREQGLDYLPPLAPLETPLRRVK